MQRKVILITFLIFCLFCVFNFLGSVFAASPAVDYLCELGVSFYDLGKYDDALSEFSKVLAAEPQNPTAQKYVNEIFAKERAKSERQVGQLEVVSPPEIISSQRQTQPKIIQSPVNRREPIQESEITKSQAITNALDSFEKPLSEEKSKAEGFEVAGAKITGEVQARLGVTGSDDVYWKRANWDLNEKNWRILSTAALDNKEDTYDPRIYDRFAVNVDTAKDSGFNVHSNIVVDPWSYTGKSDKFTIQGGIPGGGGWDALQLQLKYWGNTGYTINENYNSLLFGDSVNIPEIKVNNGYTESPVQFPTPPPTPKGNTYIIPEGVKIYQQFQPIREFWFDYKTDNLKLKVFPIAYENQAVTFDDPLRLSNNHIWWEDSPWIRSWHPGQYNSGLGNPDFIQGYWDNSLSFFTRDSEGRRLTALRGFSFDFTPFEKTSITSSIATPKTLWQDYSQVDNYLSATRLNQSIADNLSLGLTATTRFAYNLDNKGKTDAKNYVGGLDMAYEVIDGLKMNLEVAHSNSANDLSTYDYRSISQGNAYNFTLLGRFPFASIMDTKWGYDGIKPEKGERFFTKFRVFATRLDSSFDEPLSSYVETRDDEFWGRHLHFRQPFKDYYQGEGQMLSWDDIKNYRIGNGVDIGRSTFGLRVESMLWDKKVNNLFDVRNVHQTNGKFVENVTREELTWNFDEKLTGKLLGIYQKLHNTVGGIDPFIFDPNSRLYYENPEIEDGKKVNIGVGSLGLEYKFFDWLSLDQIYEYTNDTSLGYDNFPRSALSITDLSNTFTQNGRTYQETVQQLYDQGLFPNPPYSYYNVFKTGLSIRPIKKLEFYLDYTRNPYEKAGQVDDNMNHFGLQMSYSPIPKLSFFLKYNYSRWQDLDKLMDGNTKLFGHHNVFAEMIFRKSQDEDFSLQYGEYSRDPYNGGVLDIGWDPFGGSLRTIDTQHIFRMYYRRKF